MARSKLTFDKKDILCYTTGMVDKLALRDAWHDYWTHPEWTAKYIAESHGILPSRLFNEFRRAGYTARRNYRNAASCRLSASDCPGYQAFFCADCPCAPRCQDWECWGCTMYPTCACVNGYLRPPGWEEKLETHIKARRRNQRALETYRYAWSSEPLEEMEI